MLTCHKFFQRQLFYGTIFKMITVTCLFICIREDDNSDIQNWSEVFSTTEVWVLLMVTCANGRYALMESMGRGIMVKALIMLQCQTGTTVNHINQLKYMLVYSNRWIQKSWVLRFQCSALRENWGKSVIQHTFDVWRTAYQTFHCVRRLLLLYFE